MTKKEREAYEKGYKDAMIMAENIIEAGGSEIIGDIRARSPRPAEGGEVLNYQDEIVFEMANNDPQNMACKNVGVFADEWTVINSQLLAIVFGWADPVTPL